MYLKVIKKDQKKQKMLKLSKDFIIKKNIIQEEKLNHLNQISTYN